MAEAHHTANAAQQPGKALYYLKLALICLLAAGLLIYCLCGKHELHNDEYTTYIIANNSGEGGFQFAPQNNVRFDNPEEPYLQAMTVAPGMSFHYEYVWRNDQQDTLPPLHYALLHTVSSFFPGRFSIWFGGVINLVFLVLGIIFLSKLGALLGMDESARLLSCLCFALLPGIMEIAQFLRMYTMSMFWVILFSYEQLKWLKSSRFGWENALGLGLTVAAGVLTHYYFVVFALFQCLMVGLYLLLSKRWKDTGFYVLTFAAAAGLCIAVFPGLLRQTFNGSLTSTSVENLSNAGDLMQRIKGFYFVINSRLFGGYLPEFAAALCIGALLLWRPKKPGNLLITLKSSCLSHFDWGCIALPSLLFMALMTKIAFFANTRYMCFIYPLLILISIQLLVKLLALSPAAKAGKGLAALLCAIVLISANRLYPTKIREYSGESGASLIQTFEQHSELDAVCIYLEPWAAENTYNINKSVNGLVLTRPEDVDKLPTAIPADSTHGLLVEIQTTVEPEPVLEQLLTLYPNLTHYEELGDCSFFHTYLLN